MTNILSYCCQSQILKVLKRFKWFIAHIDKSANYPDGEFKGVRLFSVYCSIYCNVSGTLINNKQSFVVAWWHKEERQG